MIINKNNKNTILNGIEKRGFNQNPQDLKMKLQSKIVTNMSNKESEKMCIKKTNLRDTYNKFRNLK